MEIFSLVPNITNPVVECHNLNLPIPTNPNFNRNGGYDANDGYHRFVGNPYLPEDDVSLYFKNMFYQSIVPLFFQHERFEWTWPIKMETLINNTDVNVTLIKDEIGFSQGRHEDPRIFVASGVLHLQDCEQGTTFESGYVAPTKKFSGSFWANNQWSHHWVEKVTSERMAYLVIAQWKFLPFYFK
jgi:hypothetical protein